MPTTELIKANPSGLKALTKQSNTPLHFAAVQGVESIMRILIKKYPKAVQQRNVNGEWPIDLAIKHGVAPAVLEVFDTSTCNPKPKNKSSVVGSS
jgi:ankyrin repeat protein